MSGGAGAKGFGGYTGAILRVDLTKRRTSVIDTSRYRAWGGGHGIGTALFWELCEDKTVSGFDPGNVVTIMTSPLGGTLAPSASRCEVQGIGVNSTPEWFTRSNFGGRFAAQLKAAGWDGIVIEGAADSPVWIDVEDSTVSIRDAEKDALWGLDAWETQERISELLASKDTTGWRQVDNVSGRWTSAPPAVLAIGPAGERRSRIASLVHQAGSAADHGGFGGVWGAKQLKAIAVSGSSPVEVDDPATLLRLRSSVRDSRAADPDQPVAGWARFSEPPRPDVAYELPAGGGGRPVACHGCITACRVAFTDNVGTGAVGAATRILPPGKQPFGVVPNADVQRYAADIAHRSGLNVFELAGGVRYLLALQAKKALGPGRLDLGIDWSKYGTMAFVDSLFGMIAAREGAGDQMAEGFWRAADAWGRLGEDAKDGTLAYPYWGLPMGDVDPRSQPYWGYGSLLGDRDINEHDFSTLADEALRVLTGGAKSGLVASSMVEAVAGRLLPLKPDPALLDFGPGSASAAGTVALTRWHRHYSRFWKQSALYCDNRFADWFSPITKDHGGFTPEGEPLFWNAVTGDSVTFEDGMEIGRRIWNLDNAIWTLQGRHRDAVVFAPYVGAVPFEEAEGGPVSLPALADGEWDYARVKGRTIPSAVLEGFKTRYYEAEGWSAESGWPTRATLEALDLADVADVLEAAGRLGA